ncbi:hypothetical protein GIB67_002799 [Kingdonia uniflora]|uniref:C2 NT-type domain-containing protein n=1 Tax=Kingdonia uniflora TaxID=39325 RepID=A0A7J7M565_9MAGN|nr:hypothetical protein GIB67_002799 [Kingdonia uniflora]
MVLGLRTQNRRGSSINVDYLIHIREIKPWPPSQSLRSLKSVLLQWENGDKSSGSTNPVVPSLGSGVGDGKIEFNESFKLPVTLCRDVSIKGGNADTFQKNCLEFNLFEPRRDKTVKGQLLGTVLIDLAEYGILKETVIISAPMNCKRSFRNSAQPALSVKVQPYIKRNISSSLSRESLLKEASLDKNGRESVSALMSGEYAEEAEIASLTDDDVSSHSSYTVSSSATGGSSPKKEESSLETMKDHSGGDHEEPEANSVTVVQQHLNGSMSCSSSTSLSSGLESPENDHASLSNFPERNTTSIIKTFVTHSGQSSSSPSIAYEVTGEEVIINTSPRTIESQNLAEEIHANLVNCRSKIKGNAQDSVKENKTEDIEDKVASSDIELHVDDKSDESASLNDIYADIMEKRNGQEKEENRLKEQTNYETINCTDVEPLNKLSPDSMRKPVTSVGDPTVSGRGLGANGNNILTSGKLRHVKSVRSPLESARSIRSATSKELVGEIDDAEDTRERKDVMNASRERKTSFSNNEVRQLERRIEKIKNELIEVATLEVSLYSIAAEHGSSTNKVHAPARRLSRMYLHGGKQCSKGRRGSAARSAVSGLVLVAKACGNDVPRLTFWLSNAVVLRTIISLSSENSQLPVSAGPHAEANDSDKKSLLKWKDSSPSKKQEFYLRKKELKNGFVQDFDDWENPHTFTAALEKIELWMFSRIIESVWWQTLTPHMQPALGKTSEQRSYEKKPSFGDQEDASFSLELWKKAFKDACERLCPVRAAGHECGCLPALSRMVMGQCISRLDVAMFNAILRESDDEVPMDPVSDPISDAKVLPIPSGKSSFGAGAQLKNAIGNWSRWLTDLFGVDDNDSHGGEEEIGDDDRRESETSPKSFHLLNALSDLMMLPKDMLLNRSIRKEVCPTFSAALIKRVLNTFTPDEFCPDPIPDVVFEALDAEDSLEAEESVENFPSNATPVSYLPPSAASVVGIIGDTGKESHLKRSGSSVLRKSYTSDDELEELKSPLTSILDGFRGTSVPSWKPKESGGQNVVRYQLLQEVWRDGH